MCKTDINSEFKGKILDYEQWIAKAEELLEVADFLEPTPSKPKELNRFYVSEYENTTMPFNSYMNTDLEEIRKIIFRVKDKLNSSIP